VLLELRGMKELKILILNMKLYILKLNKKKRSQISVLDYTDSIENNVEAWKRLTLFDDIPLSKAFKIAEKADRLNYMGCNQRRHPSNPSFSANTSSFNNKINFHPPIRNKLEQKVNIKPKEDNDIEELTRKMRNLTIKACYFCTEPSHYQNNCPKLRAIVEKNRKEIRNNKRLN